MPTQPTSSSQSPFDSVSACGENCHGRYEYVPVEDMETMTQVLKTLICDLVE